MDFITFFFEMKPTGLIITRAYTVMDAKLPSQLGSFAEWC